VAWSGDGIAGLVAARSSRPDAMIVDRMLPGMDGLAIVETLRQEQVRTPVLVLSALERAGSCVLTRCVAARY
jgi:two-component system OmpR family response regulator